MSISIDPYTSNYSWVQITDQDGVILGEGHTFQEAWNNAADRQIAIGIKPDIFIVPPGEYLAAAFREPE